MVLNIFCRIFKELQLLLFTWFYDYAVFQNVPPDLAICCFILEQSLSVRALQEMLSNTSVDEV